VGISGQNSHESRESLLIVDTPQTARMFTE
jgi:hypothetical protein